MHLGNDNNCEVEKNHRAKASGVKRRTQGGDTDHDSAKLPTELELQESGRNSTALMLREKVADVVIYVDTRRMIEKNKRRAGPRARRSDRTGETVFCQKIQPRSTRIAGWHALGNLEPERVRSVNTEQRARLGDAIWWKTPDKHYMGPWVLKRMAGGQDRGDEGGGSGKGKRSKHSHIVDCSHEMSPWVSQLCP
ncbi:hypothetical protein K438DRAFT_1787351 [Mycena galopus ATCC 62051]|nr:hypothetical protein K438DRAFT_1787351 [Mycena galopus ATCC 62051]